MQKKLTVKMRLPLRFFRFGIALNYSNLNVDKLNWVGHGIMAQNIAMVLIVLMALKVMENIKFAKYCCRIFV
jgi:hypothetical protein